MMLTMEWSNVFKKEELIKMRVGAVNDFLKCDTPASTESTVEFARYLHFDKFDSFNYPIYLELFKSANHNVIQELVKDKTPFDLFSEINANYYIVDFAFKLLYGYKPGGVHPVILEIIFGILYRNYHSAKEGFELYPLSIENLNAIGKFLDKAQKQTDKINRFILDILADISNYKSINKESELVDKISAHAIDIRNAYFDRRVQMDSVLPPEILLRGNYEETTVHPRATQPVEG